MPLKISFADSGEANSLDEDDEQFRQRLSSIPAISENRRRTILQEVDILEEEEDEDDNDDIDGNNNATESSSNQRSASSESANKSGDSNSDDEPSPRASSDLKVEKPEVKPEIAAAFKPPQIVQYWQNLPEVVESGLLQKLSKDQIKMNEAVYEIFKAVRSFYVSLCVITDVFKTPFEQKFASSHKFICKNLFLNITTITEVTDRLIGQLEEVQGDNVQMEPACIKVVGEFADELFEKPFTFYCSNKESQNKALQDIESHPQLSLFLRELQKDPKCQMMPLSAFLLKPMQMLTKWPILLYAVKKYEQHCPPLLHFTLKKTITKVENLAANCDKFRTQLAHQDKLITIETQTDWSKNSHYPLTSRKKDVMIFLDKCNFRMWSKLLPNQNIGKSPIRFSVKKICDVRLICFDDGSLLLLSPINESNKKCKLKYRFLNYAARWRLITDQNQIFQHLESEVQSNTKDELTKLSRTNNVGLVVLESPYRIQPNKVVFLSSKQSTTNQIDVLSECVEKLPEKPAEPEPDANCSFLLATQLLKSPNSNGRASQFNLSVSKSAHTFQLLRASNNPKSTKPKKQGYSALGNFLKSFRSVDNLASKNDNKIVSIRQELSKTRQNEVVKMSEDRQIEEGSLSIIKDTSIAVLRKRSEPQALRFRSPSTSSDSSNKSATSSFEIRENFYTSPVNDNKISTKIEPKTLIVIESYEKKYGDEISVEKDEVLQVCKEPTNGWILARRQKTGKTGWVPPGITKESDENEIS